VPASAERGVAVSTSSAGLLNADVLSAYRRWASNIDDNTEFTRSIAA
jgi:hypothetical protein